MPNRRSRKERRCQVKDSLKLGSKMISIPMEGRSSGIDVELVSSGSDRPAVSAAEEAARTKKTRAAARKLFDLLDRAAAIAEDAGLIQSEIDLLDDLVELSDSHVDKLSLKLRRQILAASQEGGAK